MTHQTMERRRNVLLHSTLEYSIYLCIYTCIFDDQFMKLGSGRALTVFVNVSLCNRYIGLRVRSHSLVEINSQLLVLCHHCIG